MIAFNGGVRSLLSLIPDNEVALNGSENLLFKQHVFLLSLGNNLLLADSLHGVIFPVVYCCHLRITEIIIIICARVLEEQFLTERHKASLMKKSHLGEKQ